MAYTKNAYYKEGWYEGDVYKELVFIPGDITDLATPVSNSFPDNVCLDNLTIKADYDNDVPLGLPLTGEMELELNLANLTGDWTDVRDWITRGYSDTKRDGHYIPNQWIFQSTYLGTTTIEFYGLQEIKPTQQYTITPNSNNLKIKVIELTRSCLERLSFADYDSFDTLKGANQLPDYAEVLPYLHSYKEVEYLPSLPNKGFVSQWNPLPNETPVLYQFHTLVNNILTKATSMAEKLTRGNYSLSLTVPYANWTFYSTDKADLTPSGSLSTTNVYVIAWILNSKGEEIAGLLSDNKKNETFYNYDSIWDFYRELSEAACEKIVTTYGASSSSVAGHTILNVANLTTDYTITKSDIIGDLTITTNYNIINRAIAHVKEAGDEDIDEITNVYDNGISYGTDSEESQEVELPIHNLPILRNVEHDSTTLNQGSRDVVYYYKTSPNFRCLYTSSGYRVNDKVQISYGDSKTEVIGTTKTPPIMNKDFYIDYQNEHVDEADTTQKGLATYYNYIQENSGMGLAYTKGAMKLLGNTGQGLLECTVKGVYPRHLGDLYIIDIDTITGITMGFKAPADFTNGRNAILVSCNYNAVGDTSDCKFYLRGD